MAYVYSSMIFEYDGLWYKVYVQLIRPRVVEKKNKHLRVIKEDALF